MPLKFAKSARKPRRKPARPARRRVAAPRRAARVARVPRTPALIQAASGLATQTALTVVSRQARHPRAGISKMAAPSYWVNSTASSFQGPPGQQLIATLGQWNSVADTIQIGSIVPPQASFYGTAPTRFCMQSMQADVTLTNSSTLTAQIDLYDIVVHTDVPISTVLDASASTPENAWVRGIQLQTLEPDPANVTQQARLPGSRPTDSQLFKDFYRIKQRKTIILAPNGMHVHHVKVKTGRMFDINQMSTYNNVMSALAGYTVFTMMVVRGMPALGSEPPGPTLSNPTIRIVTSERYQYSFVYENGSAFSYGNTLTPSAVVNQLLLQSPATGVPVYS